MGAKEKHKERKKRKKWRSLEELVKTREKRKIKKKDMEEFGRMRNPQKPFCL